jgi:pyruvate formate lyase activating enzyme
MVKGRIHSIETCGTVDGPGIRVVVFTQGCPLRCRYCHNPDTWQPSGGREVSVPELVAEIEKYRSYLRCSGGGVTVSGGEPLMQAEFVQALFRACREREIHTALDTSGYVRADLVAGVLEVTDLVLLDIKSIDVDTFRQVTNTSLAPPLAFARYLVDIDKPVWVRHVLVPGLTDNPEHLEKLAQFVGMLPNVEKVELLPFHKMGEFKWRELGFDYQLAETREPSDAEVASAKAIFLKYGLAV